MAATIISEGTFDPADTSYSEPTPDEAAIHDLENAGERPIRFVTVELLE